MHASLHDRRVFAELGNERRDLLAGHRAGDDVAPFDQVRVFARRQPDEMPVRLAFGLAERAGRVERIAEEHDARLARARA